jgi:transposase
MSQAILGIDIAKRSYEMTLLQDGHRYHRTFRNHPDEFGALDKWLQKHRVERAAACMEATGTYWEGVAYHLYQQGHRVSVVNPARICAYARSKLVRNKTDRLDGDLIADFCATQQPSPWTPPPAEVQELKALVRHLEDLQQMHTQESNRLTSGVSSPTVRQTLEAHLAFLAEQISSVQAQIEAHIQQQETLRPLQELLVSIPGIGKLTAAKLLSENIQAFSSTRALVAYAGLSPQLRESGTSVHGRPRLSKIGSRTLRTALYFPAISARRHNPLVRALCDRLEEKHKHKRVILGAAMRKLLCLALGVLKSGIPFREDYREKVQMAP